MSVRTFLMRGRRWKLQFRPLSRMPRLGDSEPVRGFCDTENRKIVVCTDQKGRAGLETLIHECLHAAYPDLDEEAVETTAYDLSKLLWRLGYRG